MSPNNILVQDNTLYGYHHVTRVSCTKQIDQRTHLYIIHTHTNLRILQS